MVEPPPPPPGIDELEVTTFDNTFVPDSQLATASVGPGGSESEHSEDGLGPPVGNKHRPEPQPRPPQPKPPQPNIPRPNPNPPGPNPSPGPPNPQPGPSPSQPQPIPNTAKPQPTNPIGTSSSKAPSDGVAVVFQGRHIIIYVNYDGELSYLESPSEEQVSAAGGNLDYVNKQVQIGKEKIKCRHLTADSPTKLPRVASVTWGQGSEERWRIFYIQENGQLDEIIWQSWSDQSKRIPTFKRGMLIQSNIFAVDNSVLAASVDKAEVRLFFQQLRPDPKKPSDNTISFTRTSRSAEMEWLTALRAARVF